MSRTTIVMDDTLQDEAKELGINVSEICREAVGEAVEAKRAVQRLGDDFKTVTADLRKDTSGDELESVQFMGRLVYTDEPNNTEWYVTSGGQVAHVDDLGQVEWGTIDELAPESYIGQLLAEALGEVVTPTFLDI